MTKRQIRIYTNEIPSGIEKVIGLPLSIVMKSGAVYFFRILELENDYLKVEDLRKQKQKLRISDIEEIIIEAEDHQYAQKSTN